MNGALSGTVSRHIPSKAEDEKGNAEEGGHSMPDQRVGVARTEVETKPEGGGQGKQLTCQKIHLCGGDRDWDGSSTTCFLVK